MRKLIIYILAALFVSGVVSAQDSSAKEFISISHSTDRTIAKDSAGQTWYFNSQSGEFEQPSDSMAVDAGDFSGADVVLPPEIRCTNVYYGDISEFFKEVIVEEDERVEGTVFSFHDIVIKGLVVKDVVSLRTVTVASTGEVRGDVIAKDIKRERGGRILGQRQEVMFPDVLSLNVPWVGNFIGGLHQFFFILFIVFLAVVVVAIAPKPLGRIVNKLSQNIIPSFFWGILFWLSLAPILILLIITIVGIPLIIIYPFTIIVAIILGFVSVAQSIGEFICHRIGWQQKSLYMRVLCGAVALEIPHILYALFITVRLESIGLFFMGIYYIIGFVALTTGIGATVSARFGMKPKPKPGQQPAPNPPITPIVVPPPSLGSGKTPPPPSPPPPPSRGENATD